MTKKVSHLGGYREGGDPLTYMPDVWGWLLVAYDVRSVVDIGCGVAVNLLWFKEMGCSVLGIEGDATAIAKAVCAPISQHDYTEGALSLSNAVDLCIALEFVEHVESKYEDNWFATMKCAKRVLISHALPGQGGYHHVNEQSSGYWIGRFYDHGFRYLEQESTIFRNTTQRKPARYGRNTLLLFERNA